MGDNDSESDNLLGIKIFNRYKLIKKLGQGSFGSIYCAQEGNEYYAIKFEDKVRGDNLLENEAKIMCYLECPGIPAIKFYESFSKYNVLVMELMGKSLEDIFESFIVKKMSSRCVCNIGYQIIEILEFIHNKHIVYRDIKPDNFVIGRNEKKKYIYLLDFGLSKKYRSSKTLKHYQLYKNKNLTGTARYASINALNGLTQSRRDDLEAVGYLLLYFLRGKLPWQGIPVKTKEERFKKIMQKKIDTPISELCHGFPYEFEKYLTYVRNLNYEDNPDYKYLKNLFLTALSNEGYKLDCYYDWDTDTIVYNRNFSNKSNGVLESTMSNYDNNNYYNNNHCFNKSINSNEIKSNMTNGIKSVSGVSGNYSHQNNNLKFKNGYNNLPLQQIQEVDYNNQNENNEEKIPQDTEVNEGLETGNVKNDRIENKEENNVNPMGVRGEKVDSCCAIY